MLAIQVQVRDVVRETSGRRSVATDDRGIYRIANLQPGRYYIKAAGKSGGTYRYVGDTNPYYSSWQSFAPVYTGGARTLDSATPVTIDPGTNAPVDFHLRLEPAFRIRGKRQNAQYAELNGLEAARRIHKLFPKTGILILTLHFSDQLVRDIVEAGARAYIMKSDADRDLVSAVEALANHRTFFTPRAAEMLLNGFSRQNSGDEPQALTRNRLTSREREIVQLLAEGKSSKEVAVALGISVKTAETHRANIMRKLELHSVSEVVRYAVKNQIIEA
jgi:DNA-binding NarL/FixJ family response regulator